MLKGPFYSIEDIARVVKGNFKFSNTKYTDIDYLVIDSRRLTNPLKSLFIAIKGERNNGHDFIEEVYNQGVRNFIISESSDFLEQQEECNYILIKNSLDALQKFCAYHRSRFSYPVIGITGSNGKTIVKEWLYHLLREDKHVVRSPKSFNSQVGVPLSVWQMRNEHDIAIFEAGISQVGEMEKLQKIIAPNIGIITNIGLAHDENFKNAAEKTAEKLKLFKDSDVIIYCKDYPTIHEQLATSAHKNIFYWSRKGRGNLQIGKVESNAGMTLIQGVYDNKFISINIPFTDNASIENAIHCWAFMLYLKYDPEDIASRMYTLTPIAMRLELKEGINNSSIINDSYNSDLISLSVALDFLNQQEQHVKKTLILSDILQSGKNEEKLYEEVAELVEKKGIQRLIGIGESISRQAPSFPMQATFYQSKSDFLNVFDPSQFQDEAILLKGARMFGFEEIVRALQKKSHETVLEVNLNALVHNLNYFRSKLKPFGRQRFSEGDTGTKIMAMVKAFSYGSGSFEVANTLQFHRVDYLAVAYVDEGVALRKAGITVPIMVMSPEEQGYDAMIQYQLEPEIFSFRGLKWLKEAIQRSKFIRKNPNYKIPVHIKLDTGMHRLGFEEKEIEELKDKLLRSQNIKVQSIFSHLAASDEKKHDDFTRKQINYFNELSAIISKALNYPILKHILNSAGIMRFPEEQMDMVRLGIGLYGVGVNEQEQAQLQAVSRLKTRITQIKTVAASGTIGYSRKGEVKKEMTIATIPIGYADGLSRSLGNGKGKVLVKDQLVPIIGNVCMDMCMIDITDLKAEEGDEVIIFGEKQSIQDIAEAMNTIPYEVLTNISQRVKRVYFHE